MSLLQLKLQLSVDTHIDRFAFAEWLHEHRFELRDQFDKSEEPAPTDVELALGVRVEDTLFIWLRTQFKARVRVQS